MGISARFIAILLPFKRHSFTNLLVYVYTWVYPLFRDNATVRTHAAILAAKRMHASLSKEERRAWGYRLRAIQGGRASQRMARMRGIDPLAAANAELRRRKLARDRAKREANQ